MAQLLFPDKYRTRTETAKIDMGPSSLGMSCLVDTQCQQVDPHTRCVNKRCDCAYRSNSTSACSTRNRGCLPGTFQVSTLQLFSICVGNLWWKCMSVLVFITQKIPTQQKTVWTLSAYNWCIAWYYKLQNNIRLLYGYLIISVDINSKIALAFRIFT